MNTLDIGLVVLDGQLVLDGGGLLYKTLKEQLGKMTLSETEIQNSSADYMGIIGSALMASDRLWEICLSKMKGMNKQYEKV